jgi:hypothetical protein
MIIAMGAVLSEMADLHGEQPMGESDETPSARSDAPPPGANTPPDAGAGAALDRAAQSWQRRGYQVWYRDEHLVQLVRHRLPDGIFIAAVVLGAVALAGAYLLARRRGVWNVVSLAVSPEGRVIVHQQRARRPPPV